MTQYSHSRIIFISLVSGMCTLENKSWEETVAELKVKFGVTYKVSAEI